ncbi:MAG TPA: PAS domain S-box protein, partial [Deltaproteobacteria bacterium]|nr:PAS domain S-box protein [Deltaproteobacteria bacterium]
TAIREPQTDTRSFETGRRDEIGTLSHEFGSMVQRLSESEKRYRESIESIQDAYLEVDLEGNMLFFNEPLCRMIQYSREEIMGKNFREFVSPGIAQDIYSFFHEVFETGKPSTLRDFEVIRKDGTKIATEFSVSLMGDAAGKTAGFRVTGRDVSDLRQAARERERLISDLQQALADVRTLSGMLPICACCKKIRDDTGYWNQIESYITEHSTAVFSHSICPECHKRLYPYLQDK